MSSIILALAAIAGIKEADMVGKTVGDLITEIKNAITGCWDECTEYFAEANEGWEEIRERMGEDLPVTPPPGSGCGPMWGALCIGQGINMSGIWPFVTQTTRKEKCQDCCIDMFNQWMEAVPGRADEAPGCRTFCDAQCNGWFSE